MDNKLITLAVHKAEKAQLLKNFLSRKGIGVFLEEVKDVRSRRDLENCYVMIEHKDLNRALSLIEGNKLFSYSDQGVPKIDDGQRRILVAVDFSDYSKKACQFAFEIANETGAKVKLLHVYQNVFFPTQLPFTDKFQEHKESRLLDGVRKQMLNLCYEIDKDITEGKWPSVNYSYSLREGQVDAEVESFVLEYKPSLLVLGTKGKDNNEYQILGNATADIIELVSVPILAVPLNSPISSITDIKHIVFLTNLQDKELTSFNYLLEIAESIQNIKITLLHINQINRKGDKWTKTELEKMGEHFKSQYSNLNIDYKLIDSPNIPQAVGDFVEKENVTIISLNTRRRNLFGRIFLPSLSREMLKQSDKALLVLRG